MPNVLQPGLDFIYLLHTCTCISHFPLMHFSNMCNMALQYGYRSINGQCLNKSLVS